MKESCQASQRCRIRQRHELDLKVKTLLEELFPLPSWKDRREGSVDRDIVLFFYV